MHVALSIARPYRRTRPMDVIRHASKCNIAPSPTPARIPCPAPLPARASAVVRDAVKKRYWHDGNSDKHQQKSQRLHMTASAVARHGSTAHRVRRLQSTPCPGLPCTTETVRLERITEAQFVLRSLLPRHPLSYPVQCGAVTRSGRGSSGPARLSAPSFSDS